MLYYKMNTQTIFMCVVALLIGMLVANMLQNVCGCKKVEGFVVVDSENNINTGANPNTDSRMSAIDQFIVNNQMNGRRANRAACGGRHTNSQSMKISEAEDILKTLCSGDTLNGAGDFNTALSDMIALGTCDAAVDEQGFVDACVASGFSTVQGGGSAGVHAPPAVNCVGEFGDWRECSVGCGGGTQSRSYTPTIPASNGGTACPEDQTQDCNTQACAVNCKGVFGDWRECSVGCGGGTQSRSFTPTTEAINGGTACPEDQTRDCNTQACPNLCETNPCENGGSCNVSTGAEGSSSPGFTCSCPTWTSGDLCQTTDPSATLVPTVLATSMTCDDMADFYPLITDAQRSCCPMGDNESGCVNGIPTTCVEACAWNILPLQQACSPNWGSFLPESMASLPQGVAEMAAVCTNPATGNFHLAPQSTGH